MPVLRQTNSELKSLEMTSALKLERATGGRPLLTAKQASEFLGVPEGTLAQWRSQRRGPPYIKLEGRLIRYRFSDLEMYIASRIVENPVEKCNA
jgi:predicted DNA-binding transcriptional regulator AlpA